MFKKRVEEKIKENLEVVGVNYDPARTETTRDYSCHGKAGLVASRQVGNETIVLYTSYGRLLTKRFDGKWTLEQVKNWQRTDKWGE